MTSLCSRYANLRQYRQDARTSARDYTREHGEDIPSIVQWMWSDAGDTGSDEACPMAAASATGGDDE